MIGNLFLSLIERLGLIVTFAFFISKTVLFKNYLTKEKSAWPESVFFAVMWGALGIVMTILGTPVAGGIANSRTIPVVLAGLLGGPTVGALSGLIAGFHRAFLTHGGELTAISCGISTFLGGFIGGLSKKRLEQSKNKWFVGLILGLIVEVLQMLIILVIARPFDQAFALVELIFLPMTFLNAIGIGMFLLIVQQIYNENDAAAALKAQMALDIANKTVPYLKQGLNAVTAEATSKIICEITGFRAVAITNEDQVLALVGTGINVTRTGSPISTEITLRCLHTGKMQVGLSGTHQDVFGAGAGDSSVIVAPLKMSDRVIGCLKVYRDKKNSVTKSDQELVKGLAALFTTQLELSSIEQQKSLREEAELKALRAQIKPHFLFNSLNTIMSLIRTDADEARRLLQELSVILRSGFKDSATMIPLKDELRVVEAFLRIEKARFPEKLVIEYDVDEGVQIEVPPLILQPIVENAVRHGIRNKHGIGTVKISIHIEEDLLHFDIADDGVGMTEEKVENLKFATGIGLNNVRDRLRSIYEVNLHIESEPDVGTHVYFSLPLTGGM